MGLLAFIRVQLRLNRNSLPRRWFWQYARLHAMLTEEGNRNRSEDNDGIAVLLSGHPYQYRVSQHGA
jgi:Tfp pilus assembly protein PilV